MAQEWNKKILYENVPLKIKITQYTSKLTHRKIFHSVGTGNYDDLKVQSETGHTLLKRGVMKKNVKDFIKKLQNNY